MNLQLSFTRQLDMGYPTGYSEYPLQFSIPIDDAEHGNRLIREFIRYGVWVEELTVTQVLEDRRMSAFRIEPFSPDKSLSGKNQYLFHSAQIEFQIF